MTDRAPNQPLRVLLSEGSSTSAREIITALGLAGHWVEICDPDRHCIGRMSRFVRRFHRCPGIGADPAGYLAFVEDLVSRGRFDVLLPTHEQGYLFAKVRERLLPHVAVALPGFESYGQALSKAAFSKVLSQLGLPQPATHFVADADALCAHAVPCVVKSAIGTASRGTFMVRDAAGLKRAAAELEERGAFADTVLVQEMIDGPIEHAQAVFCSGRLVAMHAYRQIARGAGGGPAQKESVRRPDVRGHLARLGAHLAWHGALSVDYVLREDGVPHYIDCNPRLVEPGNALRAGLDLTDVLLRVSLGEEPPEAPDSRVGVRTHIAIQALLGCALTGGTRRDLVARCRDLIARRGSYAGSHEELTPVRADWLSALPAVATAVALLARPAAAQALARQGWGAHLLTIESIRAIRDRISAQL